MNKQSCGTCRHGLPCEKIYKGQAGISNMAGWLACEIKQGTAEQRSAYISPKHPACNFFKDSRKGLDN